MATVLQSRARCLQCLGKQLPQVSQVRTKVRYVVNNPRKYPRPIKFRVFKEITRPIELVDESKEFPCPKLTRISNKQKSGQEQKQLTDYDRYMMRKMKKMFEDNKLIAVCQPLSCGSELAVEYLRKLKMAGFRMYKHNNYMMRMVSEECGYKALHPLMIAHNAYLTNEEPKVPELLKVLRKTHAYILIGGVVDGQVLSRSGMMQYAKMPNIELQRGELVSILNLAAGGRTHSLLSSHQQQLSANLEQYIKQNQEENNT